MMVCNLSFCTSFLVRHRFEFYLLKELITAELRSAKINVGNAVSRSRLLLRARYWYVSQVTALFDHMIHMMACRIFTHGSRTRKRTTPCKSIGLHRLMRDLGPSSESWLRLRKEMTWPCLRSPRVTLCSNISVN